MKIHNNVKSRGFTLLEVLVSVLVMSTGLLGIASLQLTGLKNNYNSELRTQAKQLAYDIADRMRSNAKEANSTSSYFIDIGETANSTIDCEANNCSEANMAEYDLNSWKTALRMKLPSGDGKINALNVPSKRQYNITVQWDDSRGESTVKIFTLRTEI